MSHDKREENPKQYDKRGEFRSYIDGLDDTKIDVTDMRPEEVQQLQKKIAIDKAYCAYEQRCNNVAGAKHEQQKQIDGQNYARGLGLRMRVGR
jgi:hypothetical protein